MENNTSDQKRQIAFPSGTTFEIHAGDITHMDSDVIVNAANRNLAHGGGVAAAIVRRGGKIIQEESRKWIEVHGPVSHSQPAFTTAGEMNCKFVIHAVGPVWGEGDEGSKLAQAIRSSLILANDLQAKSISFPAISTGIFGFPSDHAADIFMEEISAYGLNKQDQSIQKITLVLFDTETLKTFVIRFDDHFNNNRQS